MRNVLQRGLGLSFLPRFWRTGIGVSQPRQLWRPLVLAMHELTTQAERLAARVQAGPSARAAAVASAAETDRVRVPDPPVHPMRVSVLLPVKNGLPHLHDAVASLAGQTHPDIEVLVIDDGSDDGGPQQVLSQALSHVRVIRSKGHGLAAALNTGLRAATGAFIARQDADDWSHPDRLARQLHYLLRHADIDLLAATADLVDAEGRPIDAVSNEVGWREYDHVQTPDAIAERLPQVNVLLAGTVLARREALRRAGGYRPEFAGAEDYDLWLRLLPEARFAKLPTRLYSYRLHARQVTRQCEGFAREGERRARAAYEERMRLRAPEIAPPAGEPGGVAE